MSHPDASTVLVFRSSRNASEPRELTHLLTMRAGEPDDVPDGLLAALDEASVYHTRLPGIGLGLVLDPTVEAALREDGFDLTRIGPETDAPDASDPPVVLPLQRGNGAAERPGTDGVSDDLDAGLRRLIGRMSEPGTGGADLQALSAILLGAGTLAANARPSRDPGLLERLTGIEAALRDLTHALSRPDTADRRASGTEHPTAPPAPR